MTTTAAGYEQLHGYTLDGEHRAIAALSVTADDLPELDWEPDGAEMTRFVLLRAGGHDFALESEDGAPAKQTTVYGRAAGDALDALLEALGVSDDQVMDRVDRESEPIAAALSAIPEDELSELIKLVRSQVAAAQAEMAERLREIEVLALGGDAITDRERDVLHLLASGLTTAEVAKQLEISHGTVRRHISRALSRYEESRPTKPRSSSRSSSSGRSASRSRSSSSRGRSSSSRSKSAIQGSSYPARSARLLPRRGRSSSRDAAGFGERGSSVVTSSRSERLRENCH